MTFYRVFFADFEVVYWQILYSHSYLATNLRDHVEQYQRKP